MLPIEEFLKELGKEIIDAQATSQYQITARWSYMAKYYKRKYFDELENTSSQFALDILLATLIIWVLEQYLGGECKSIPSLDDTLDSAKEIGILFDSTFTARLRDTFQVARNINLDLRKIWDIIPKLDLPNLFDQDLLGTTIQELLPHRLRKAIAANYTSIVTTKFLAALSIREDVSSIIDPFAGSGRLITALIEEYFHREVSDHPSIVLNELLDLAAYLSALRLLSVYIKRDSKASISFHLGDAFGKLCDPLELSNKSFNCFKAIQMVIMNPPFTRYLRLSNRYIETIGVVCGKYKKFISPQMGLHVFSLFLADSILMPSGRIAAVLPAPTFYSKYADGLKEFLLSQYHIRLIIGTSTDKSFSEGSSLKEIILVADKRRKGDNAARSVLFASLNVELTNDNFRAIAKSIWDGSSIEYDIGYRRVLCSLLKKSWNWIRYLEHDELYSLAETVLASSKIQSVVSLDLRIVRGFEMYGPDFFFLPNSHWKKTHENEKELIFAHKDTGKSYKFPRDILLRSLRKPSLYGQAVSPMVEHYVLRIKKGQENLVPKGYIEERREEWQVAEKRFGNDWMHHIDHQLNSKQPFGNLFTIDKFGITTTGTIIHYFNEEITASKNFYLIDCNPRIARFLAAWMSSTFFILLFLVARREIGGAFGRLQIMDYQEEPILLDISKIPKETQSDILASFEEFRSLELPSLRDQIGWEPRKKLDLAILNALEIEEVGSNEFLESVYQAVTRSFDESDSRGRKNRGRE